MKKPYGVFMLLSSGERWMFCREATLGEALQTARTLKGDLPMFPQYKVWIAAPPKIGLKPKLEHFRKQRKTRHAV